MKVAVLFSGGKDSSLAMHKEMENNEIVCLISVISRNKESYMFHTPNIDITQLQSEATGIPLLQKFTEGVKEEELSDLRDAISDAKESYDIEGIVTGAVESVYQSSRIQKICDELGLQCLNPLWKMDQKRLLEEVVSEGFDVIISGFFAYPLDRKWLGRKIDTETIAELVALREKHRISPAGEGGEIETTVLDAPFFGKRIEIRDTEIHTEEYSGVMEIKKAELVTK